MLYCGSKINFVDIILCNISNKRNCFFFTKFPNTEKRVESVMFIEVFATNIDVFGMW